MTLQANMIGIYGAFVKHYICTKRADSSVVNGMILTTPNNMSTEKVRKCSNLSLNELVVCRSVWYGNDPMIVIF